MQDRGLLELMFNTEIPSTEYRGLTRRLKPRRVGKGNFLFEMPKSWQVNLLNYLGPNLASFLGTGRLFTVVEEEETNQVLKATPTVVASSVAIQPPPVVAYLPSMVSPLDRPW